MRKLVILGLGAALAYLSAVAATANAIVSANPDLAASMPLGSGMAQARLARVQIGRKMARDQEATASPPSDFPAEVDRSVVDLAKRAYRDEPLATDAIGSLAIAANADADANSARRLFGQVHEITRRDEAVSLWLALDAARRGRVDDAMTYFDELLRTSSASRALLLQRLAVVSADPKLRGSLAQKLRANPPWLSEFWDAGSATEAGAQAIGQLVRDLAPNVAMSATAKERLALNLLAGGHASLAEDIYERLSNAGPKPTVANAKFRQPSVFPPIDWQTYSTGDFSAEIMPAEGVMYVGATGYPADVAARQFVVLQPGRYRLGASARLFSLGEGEQVLVRLSCRLGGSWQPVQLRLTQGTASVDFSASTACAGYFLDVVPVTTEGTQGFDAEVTGITIDRL